MHGLLRAEADQGLSVLLIDGLDLQQDRAAAWFGHGTVLVDPDLPALVAVAPTVVARWPADLRDPKFTLLHLPPFPVLGRDRRASWDGVNALAEMLVCRLSEPDVLLEKRPLLNRIALMSGGVPRDALRILRAAVLSAAKRGAAVSMADVVSGERELRQDLEQAFIRDDPSILRSVFDDLRFLEHDPRLLTMGAVLSYQDDAGIYALPHPVLWAGIDADRNLAVDAAVAGNAP